MNHDLTARTLLELTTLNSAFRLLGCQWSPELRRVTHIPADELPHPDAPEESRGRSIFQISVKPSGMVYFKAKPAQLRLLTAIYEETALGIPAFLLILKARQIGFTTCIALLILAICMLKQAVNAMVAAHVPKSQINIFNIYLRAYRFLETPEYDKDGIQTSPGLKPKKQADNLTHLMFEENQSSMSAYVAKEGSLGVSTNHTLAHFSEFALWKGDAGQTYATAMDSVAKTVGSIVFIETTSRGRGNKFYDLWREADEEWGGWDRKNGPGGYPARTETFGNVNRDCPWRPLFFSWMDDEDYRVTPPADWQKTTEEREFQTKHRCDDAQLYWRNRKVAEKAGAMSAEKAVAHFDRENPTTPDHAFTYAGDSQFDEDKLAWLRKSYMVKSPEYFDVRLGNPEKGATGGAKPLIFAIHNPPLPGMLRIFGKPMPNREYFISADPTRNQGKKPDPAALHVWDTSTVSQVAAFDLPVDPYAFADILCAVGLFYNYAFLAPENNEAGLGTCLRLQRELRYGKLYYDVPEGTQRRHNLLPGFSTNNQSKEEIIVNGQRYIKELRPVIHDPRTFEELDNFRRDWDEEKSVYTDNQGPNTRKNLVMALLIGLFVGNFKYRWFNQQRKFIKTPVEMLPESAALDLRADIIPIADLTRPERLLSYRGA